MEKTYLEILAEQDTEARIEYVNPKDLLVEHNVFEQEVNGDDHHEDELEDQHDFQTFGGSHQVASQLGALHSTQPKHTTAVEYSKNVQVHVISVDSRFRTNRQDFNHNFLYKMDTQIKNVVSVRASSMEIPNTWYTFSTYRGNTTFILHAFTEQTFLITIPEGNYSLDTSAGNCLQTTLARVLNTALPSYAFTVVLDSISGLLTISALTNFSLDFTNGIFSGRIDDWGLGYNLGFRNENFPIASPIVRQTKFARTQTASALPDITGSNYIFLSLNPDWRVVEHNHPDHSNLAAFAKIVVDVKKNEIIYDNTSNLITKEYTLKQPTNISSFNISLYDEYGQYILLRGGEVSLTLEVTEVRDSALYESLRK